MSRIQAIRRLARDLGAEWRTLGPAFTAKHVYSLAANAGEVLRHRLIAPAEAGIRDRFSLRFYGRELVFDCGLVSGPTELPMTFFREMFIRNMYFRYLDVPRMTLRHCIDAGANQLIVSYVLSCLSGGQARILAIEPQENPNWAFRNWILSQNLGIAWEKAFLVAKGEHSLPAILAEHQFDAVDYAKFDIEGSEYGVFADDFWLAHVGNLSMELHPASGDNSIIAGALARHRFAALFCDKWGQPCDTKSAEFLYASRTGHLLARPQTGADVLTCTRIERRPLARGRWGVTA